MVLFRKSVYKDGARVIVRSKLPEFQDLNEQQFDTELDVTWQECLSNRGIQVSETKHVVKTKKTKCLVTDTVEEMTMCYKRDVVLRIWICKYSQNRPPKKPQRPRTSDLWIDERSLLSEDSAGEPEDSQDEGENEADEDPEDVFFRPPVLQPQALNETTSPRRGRGRPRKIPARFVETPPPDARTVVEPVEETPHSLSRTLRSSTIHRKSYKSSSKLPNFGSRNALAQKKKNDDLLAKLPPHVKKVRINFQNSAKYSKTNQSMTLNRHFKNGPTFAEQKGNLQKESTKIFLLHNGRNEVAGPSSSQIVPVGTSRIIDSASTGCDAMEKDSFSNHAISPLKRYHAGIDGSLPKKKYAASDNEGTFPLGPLAASTGTGQWGSNVLGSSLASGVGDSRSLTIVPNSTKWGAPTLLPPKGAMKQLVKGRVDFPLGESSAPVLTPNAIAKSAAGVQKTDLTSVRLNETATVEQNISEECLFEMPKLEVQVPLNGEDDDFYDQDPFLPSGLTSNADFLSSGLSDVGKPTSTVSPVKVSREAVVKVKKLVLREATPSCSRKMKLVNNVNEKPLVRRLKKVRDRNAATDRGSSGKKTVVSLVPPAPVSTANVALAAAAPNGAPIPPSKGDAEGYGSQDEYDDSDLEHDDIKFKRAVYHYWKRLKPMELRLMQTELRNLRENVKKEYSVCKEIPYSYTSLTTALRI